MDVQKKKIKQKTSYKIIFKTKQKCTGNSLQTRIAIIKYENKIQKPTKQQEQQM